MKRLFLFLFLLFTAVGFVEARIARFYFDKAYPYMGQADKKDFAIMGTFIITFDTTAKTVSVNFSSRMLGKYTATRSYYSVSEGHYPTYNMDTYLFTSDKYGSFTIYNSYYKRGKYYDICFSNPSYEDGYDSYCQPFMGYFGVCDSGAGWMNILFERPYKIENN